MTLTLTIRNVAALDNGTPTELVLHRRGAIVGRSASCDWSLPDPRNHISSRHFEIRFDDRSYLLSDVSTNGTFLNGASERMREPRRIEHGDLFQVGHYEIEARLSGEASEAAHQRDAGAAPSPEWRGWDSGSPPAPTAQAGGWDAPPPAPATGAGDWGPSPAPAPPSSGWDSAAPPPASGGRWQPQLGPSLARPEPHRAFGAPTPAPAPPPPASGGWAPSHRAPDPPVASAWASATPTPDPASAWSSAAPDRPAAPSPDDIWGKIAEGNVVDWARGGFGQPIERPRDPLGLDPAPAQAALPPEPPQMTRGIDQGWGASPPSAPAAAPPPPPPAPAPAPASASAGPSPGERFVVAAGLPAARVADLSPAMIERAGALFRRLVAGLVVMVEARARAKAQLGAEATQYNPQGTNPIKFARTPDEVLALLLAPPQPGFMPPESAVEDAFRDLQSHQVATLRAMQGALKATLDRFSPAAIRTRAESKGLLERVIPAARDAALWQAYEREFGGVAQGSDEAFMDVFAKEFRRAYNDQARR